MLLTASPYRHLVYYTTGMANLKMQYVNRKMAFKSLLILSLCA